MYMMNFHFATACNEVGDGEGSKIVSIQAVTKQEDMDMNSQGSFQVFLNSVHFILISCNQNSLGSQLGLVKLSEFS